MDMCLGYSFSGDKCYSVISVIDPEARYCAKHRRCVLPKRRDTELNINEEIEKLTDYKTFKSCLIQ